MKGSLAKAARVFDALRIKLASEENTVSAVSEVPAEAVTTDVVLETVVEVAEVPATEAVVTEAVTEELPTETEEKE